MPVIHSVKKAMRGAERKKVFNLRRKQAMKSAIKNLNRLVSDKKMQEAVNLLPSAYKAIDKAKKRGIIKSNTASRRKSQLARLVNVTDDKK